MPYFRVDDGFDSHPKVVRAGDAAIGMWVRAGAWCMRYLTDGFIPAWWVRQQPGGTAKAKKLVDVGLWRPARNSGEAGWEFHEWRQDSREKVEADRQKARERQAKSRGESRRDIPRDSQRTSGYTHTPTQEVPKGTSIPPNPPHESSLSEPLSEGHGKALARMRDLNLSAHSVGAHRIAEAYSASLPTPIESGLLNDIAVQIDKCLRDGISAQAIAAGLKAWTASDSWSPTQLSRFVHKANNKPTTGKATAKAQGYDQAVAELLKEVQTL